VQVNLVAPVEACDAIERFYFGEEMKCPGSDEHTGQ